MVSFPNCKINLGLNITRKRNDGFHDIETVFYPLPLYDVLEIIARPNSDNQEEISFSNSGIPLELNAEDNLSVKAYRLLKKDFPHIPVLQIHLHKSIPMGSGLGGGSADAAFALRLINDKFDLSLSSRQLMDYALRLGSDCPFFIINKPCFATGRGETLETLPVDLGNYKILLVNPAIHVHTAHAFSQVTPAPPGKSIKLIIQQPVASWKNELKNDFEEMVSRQYPEIRNIKDELYRTGAIYASMSGSGSTVYGIYEKEKKTPSSFPGHYFVRELTGQL
ncbi:MAG: 4-(cytidine 5'-diphospho)-2-C-methyl-D-erythritol kinase [Bacteroidota bacterium]|nr:4-(cytidine 5'-diphospho)-2-C-methyl-D-erythritol kinase [Bacteroidota bacterium]